MQFDQEKYDFSQNLFPKLLAQQAPAMVMWLKVIGQM